MDDERRATQRRRGARAARRCNGGLIAAVGVVVEAVFPEAGMVHRITFGGSMEP
jgi:hypothetical protein